MNGNGLHLITSKLHHTPLRFTQLGVCSLTLLSLLLLLQPTARGQSTTPIMPVSRLEQSPLDQPLALLLEAKRNYASVQDYTCTLLSQENVRGKLHDQNIIALKVKTQPFSVYMRWLAPKNFYGQEVAFVLGRNNNKMRVKSNIFGTKIIGFMSIDPNDPRVLEHSRHNIFEAGIGNLIERTISLWEMERKVNKTQVKIAADFEYNKRPCFRIETVRPERSSDTYCHRCVLFLDKTSKLPIRVENYDWPQPGQTEGELLESFSYVNLQFNVGLRDEEFRK